MDINGARRMFELQSNAGQVMNAYTAFAQQWPKDALILAQARDERLAEVKAEPKMQRRERRENTAALEAIADELRNHITDAGTLDLVVALRLAGVKNPEGVASVIQSSATRRRINGVPQATEKAIVPHNVHEVEAPALTVADVQAVQGTTPQAISTMPVMQRRTMVAFADVASVVPAPQPVVEAPRSRIVTFEPQPRTPEPMQVTPKITFAAPPEPVAAPQPAPAPKQEMTDAEVEAFWAPARKRGIRFTAPQWAFFTEQEKLDNCVEFFNDCGGDAGLEQAMKQKLITPTDAAQAILYVDRRRRAAGLKAAETRKSRVAK